MHPRKPADQTGSLLSGAASYGTDYPDGGGDEYENREEGPGEYRAHTASSDQRFSRGDIRSRKRTHVPWLESDDLRLLAYGKYMDMEWKDIFELFPDRTPRVLSWHVSAFTVQKVDYARYHTTARNSYRACPD